MTAHWFPHLDKFWEKGGGCRSEASGGTAKHSSSLFRFGDDVCDKELEGCGDGGLGGLYKDAAPKDMAFLPLHADTLSRRGLQSWKNAFTRPSALSFPFVSWRKKKEKKNHNNINTKRKKKGLALFPLSLSGCRPWGRGESESLYSSYFLPQTSSACQWKERERPSNPIPLWTDNTIILTQGLLIPRVR